MQVREFLLKLRQFDAYPKTLEDFRVKTYGGAIVTVMSSILMSLLFISEVKYYMTKEVHQELFVDTSRGQKLRINIDITFPHFPCEYLIIDSMDVSGDQHIDVDTNLFKHRLNNDGQPISEIPIEGKLGSRSHVQEPESTVGVLDPGRCEGCYGAEGRSRQCCNTCEEVRDAYRQKGWAFVDAETIIQCKREGWSKKMESVRPEGCRAVGYLEVNKVAGNFHFAPGKSFQQHHVHVHDVKALGDAKFNSSHSIDHLSFGMDYPGIVNPLDHTMERSEQLQTMYQYFIKIVPTTYTDLDEELFVLCKMYLPTKENLPKYRRTLFTNQYSVTKHSKSAGSNFGGGGGLPGVFFIYELSPMMLKYTEKRRSFMHFLTSVCAIVGGVFTVAGLIDSAIYRSANIIRKIELGKMS